MARVQGIISAGLAAASTNQGAETSSIIERTRERSQADIDVRSAGLPNDILPTVAAGAGAGMVFGPIGAIIGAGLVKHFAKKRRQGIAAFANQEAGVIEESLDRGAAAINNAFENADTDADRAKIAALRDEFETERAATAHPDFQTRTGALVRALNVSGQLDVELERAQEEAQERTALDKEQFATEITRADGIRDDNFKESANYLTREDAYKRMLAVEDTSWGDQVMMVNAFKIIDPNSAVLPGEAATAANVAGVPDFLITAYNRLVRNGGRIDPDDRADLLRQSGLQYGEARAAQVDRNTDAIGRARAQGVRQELLPQIGVPVPNSDELPYPLPRREQDATDFAALHDLRIDKDANGIWRVFDPDGTVVLDRPLPQDATARFLEENPDADLNDDGTKKSFFEALTTPGGIDARRARLERERAVND